MKSNTDSPTESTCACAKLEKPSLSLFSQTLSDKEKWILLRGGQMTLVPQKTGKMAHPSAIALDLMN